MTRTMTRAATWIFLAMGFGAGACAQVKSDPSAEPPDGFTLTMGTATLSSSSSSTHKLVRFEGLLARSDGQTLSIELPDERVMRFRLDAKTRYSPEGTSGRLAGFRTADVVEVKAEPAERGYFLAHSVAFIRRPSAEEQAEVLQCPELNYRREENVIESVSIDPARDNRRLSLVAKPDAMPASADVDSSTLKSASSGSLESELLASIRRRVQGAFDRLPNFRAKLITSMFHSTSKNVKWVPNGVIASEVAYEGENEQYSDIQVNGKRPSTAPATADSEYMRSFNNAWSSGDFETISHCVFEGLQDSDFHKVATELDAEGELAVYEFAGGRASTCIAVRSESQVAYPSYKGSLKVRMKTGDVVHVELEATDMPTGFPLDRAERSVDFGMVRIGAEQFLLPTTGYWFGCYRNSYSCFLNRLDFRDYRHFASDSTLKFGGGN
ncbi:MAG: hypothetical protein ACLPWF_10355 [Bryobacteraceae bacterium]